MDLASKLQLKTGQSLEAHLVPNNLAPALAPLWHDVEGSAPSALLIFVLDRAALEENRAILIASARLDHLTWVAYPKAGQLATDLNRDSLAASLVGSDVQPVRQISLDEVWSALRLRPGN